MRERRGQNRGHKKSIGLTIFLSMTSIIMITLVIWIGKNDWDLEKSFSWNEQKQQHPDNKNVSTAVKEDDDELKSSTDKRQESKQETTNSANESSVKSANAAPKVDDTIGKASSTSKVEATQYIEGQQLPDEPTYIKGILIANKQYPLPSSFAPGESKEARAAFEMMAADAELAGLRLTAFSTYRSYEYQVSLYDRYVKRDGKAAADRYSARPGYSEHQTGLAFDIGEVNHEQHWASSSFGETEAGKWLLTNAHKYGFILRYPKGKEHITGYMHESWHFRYVGREVAEDIFKRDLTLEEYLEIR